MILTNLNETITALSYYTANNASLWAILGQTSAWEDESNPPAPDPTTTSVNQAFCAQQATLATVEEVEGSGTWTFLDSSGAYHYYNAVSQDTFLADGDTTLLFKATFTGANLIGLASQFRTVGFAVDLVPADGYSEATFLAAANVSSFGNLITLENRIAVAILNTSTYIVYGLVQL